VREETRTKHPTKKWIAFQTKHWTTPHKLNLTAHTRTHSLFHSLIVDEITQMRQYNTIAILFIVLSHIDMKMMCCITFVYVACEISNSLQY
jgi:hypothetical protein